MNRELKNQMSRDKILNASLNEFGERNYFEASTNTICKKNDISKGLLFHYFKSKDELFLWCIKKCCDDLVEYIELNFKISENDLETNLNEYFNVRNQFFRDNPNYHNIFKNTVVNPPEHLKEKISELKNELKELNRKIILELMENLALRKGITQENIIKLIFDFADYLLVKKYDIDQEECSRELVIFINMLFYGVVKREGE